KDNGVNILKSIDEGPSQMGTVWEPLAEGTEGAPHLGPKQPRVYSDLSPIEKDQYNAEIRATNILLQGGLKDSNYDQLYAYLKQHKTHANKNKMMLDRFTQHTMDPLDLMSNVSHQYDYSQSSSTPPSMYVPLYLADKAHLDSGLSPIENLIKNLTNRLALLTQSYKTFLPQTNNQLKTSSNTRNQATVQDGRVVVQNIQGRQNRGHETNPRDDYDAFDSDVVEAPTAQPMFMVNLSYADPVYDEARPSYDSNILSEEHFKGTQKALTKEIKEMKDVFEELEAEVAQNVVDRKHDEIERKNLLIVNDNLLAECLSKEVFYVVTNCELNVSRFTKMHVANTTFEARCLELEAELSDLRGKSHCDNHDELVNCFSKLEVHHLNLQLKYQNLKDSFGNNQLTPDKDTLNFDSVFVIGKMQASLQGKDNVIKKMKKKISHLQETHSEADRTLDFKALDSRPLR
nr:hypothetical protein [Tanacetum cinerariifolium]